MLSLVFEIPCSQKKLAWPHFLEALLLSCALSVATPDVHAKCSHVFRVAWSAWLPYSYLGHDGRPTGLDIEMINSVMHEAGCEVEYLDNIPSKRQFSYLLDGQLDLQFAASATEERKQQVLYSEPYRREVISMFVRAGELENYPVKKLDDLLKNQWRIIGPYNGWFGKDYETLRPKLREAHRLTEYLNTPQGLLMLAKERGDVLIGDYFSFIYTAKQSPQTEIALLPIYVNDNPVHFIFSKKTVSADDVATINAAIKRLAQQGELRKLLEKYGLKATTH